MYDLPPSRRSPHQGRYDTPPSQGGDTYDAPPPGESYAVPPPPMPCPEAIAAIRHSPLPCYDVPRSLLHSQTQLTPSSSASSLTADSMSSSNRSSLAAADYDVPRSCRPVALPSQTYDVPPSSKELPLELNSALDCLARLQGEVTATISRLLGFAGVQWREKQKLEPKLLDVRLSIVRLRTALHDLAEFTEGSLANAAKAPDKNLPTKLKPLARALKESDRIVQEAATALDHCEWSIDILSRPPGPSSPPDALDQIVACARTLTEDVRQTTSFIHGNATLLFRRSISPVDKNTDDYDYVNLESKESIRREEQAVREVLPQELRPGFDRILADAEAAEQTIVPPTINDASDRQVAAFYANQATTYARNLTSAIDAFLQTVEHNQPPRVFLSHGQFVVLSAHRLVYIGDTVHRNAVSVSLRQRALQCANALSAALNATVHKTKRAAQSFPSVSAVQDMVDAVVDVSHLAHDLKMCLVTAAQPQ